jgi:hypothetical protein
VISELNSSLLGDKKYMNKRSSDEKKHKDQDARMKYGKRYKDFVKKDDDAPTKTSKGVRALHKGKWGYMKDKQFTAD